MAVTGAPHCPVAAVAHCVAAPAAAPVAAAVAPVAAATAGAAAVGPAPAPAGGPLRLQVHVAAAAVPAVAVVVEQLAAAVGPGAEVAAQPPHVDAALAVAAAAVWLMHGLLLGSAQASQQAMLAALCWQELQAAAAQGPAVVAVGACSMTRHVHCLSSHRMPVV